MPQFFDRRNQSDKRMRRESQHAQNKNDAFENSGEVTKGRPNYLIGGTSRFSSNDKQLVSLPKRQSAVLKDSMPISRASDSKVVPLHEQDDEAEANIDSILPSAGTNRNLAKGSSRGSLNRRVFAPSNSSGYYTNSQARVQSKVRSGKTNPSGPKDTFEMETLLSNE